MRILDRSVFVGPSLYAHFPVIRLELDLGQLEQWPTARLGETTSYSRQSSRPGRDRGVASAADTSGVVRPGSAAFRVRPGQRLPIRPGET